jgi:hypothetical protein
MIEGVKKFQIMSWHQYPKLRRRDSEGMELQESSIWEDSFSLGGVERINEGGSGDAIWSDME